MTLQKSILHHSLTLAEWGGSYSFSSSSFCLQGIESKLFFFLIAMEKRIALFRHVNYWSCKTNITNKNLSHNLKIISLLNRNTNSQQSTASFLLINLLFLVCCLSLCGVRKINEDSYSGQIRSLYAATSNNILYVSCSQLLCLKLSALARKGYPV